MAGLTQKRFAQLLVGAQSALDMGNDVLAGLTGIDATTISRYRSATYKSGPPSGPRRALLERAMGLPEGYLSDEVELSLEALRALRRPVPGQAYEAMASDGARASDAASVRENHNHRTPTVEEVWAMVAERLAQYRAAGETPPLPEVFRWMAAARAATRSSESGGSAPA